jgi:CheY-like chemotaxis protein
MTPMLAADAATTAKDTVIGLAWPVLVGLVLWKLGPTIRGVIESRAFTVKVAGTEISVQQASDALAHRVDDLREQVSALRAQADGDAEGGAAPAEDSPIASGVPRLRRVLWVDDHPENNVYEVAALRSKDVDVLQVRSTAEATDQLANGMRFDAVITDMGRAEDGRLDVDAGIDLIEALRARGIETPVLVYASASAVARTRDRVRTAGGYVATSSATELLEALGRLGMR